ncbi:transporter substrate-binding domain-containing protein [Bermanella marisrubri]|uniref:ABC-type amino acid transport/signal transduction systems, periplasmic component/domain n=1 Tax=Bermanella marisrubri TaxID=207949 RepID=Q1N3D8_9GAMM|nr:transporter substrate-binding domain-containing protein [Bermanella marisrubri]EAT12653.1 ABC-type amino acid transport/signal transduction systems, periplasmic component/domain [Oceanobacter sp. RED65] [Bermanella marisrubri]QIZ85222.1 transporter substrate-binding domain-containing protein [Bermanella marisrubri]
MKRQLLTLFSALALSVSANAADPIRVAVDAPYPPFEYKAPDGSLTGFEIELGNAVCQEITKQDCDWVIQAWDGIIPGLLARKYDMIFSSMSINEKRKQKVLFSEPYYQTPSAFFAEKGNGFNPTDSKGKRIGVQRATVQDTYLTEMHKEAEIVRYTTADDMVIDLKGERLDALFVDAPVGESMLKDDKGYEQVGDMVNKPVSIFGEGIAAAFNKRNKDLEKKVSAALKKLKNDGTYDRIMKKYFSYSIKI